ncbi:peptidylprolyl isomerase [Pseudoteredinibacter isoporae]|uniref:peptidylprolyl isomerase n=2 Tax=Pseudoteredinibacter isoporae TaxID=570281 RepID=A0A7X0JQU9_9GAMM|nr:peptidylprolyl isomerase [Pseudoteredinibacter isoporae]MBB6520109.1 parvulin-like peptidyl-prolyl isomerase [Pseudoteredinibacter isoporae]
MIKKSLKVLAMLSVSSMAFGGNVLTAGDIVVTDDDVKYFIEQGIPADKRKEALADKDIYRQIAENLFLTKKLASLANNDKSIDVKRIRWVGEYQTDNELKESVLAKVVEASLEGVNFDSMAKDIYEKEKSSFMSEEKNRVSHILVSNKLKSEEEALELAKSLKVRADKGEDFGKLAKEFSDDPSAKFNSGDVGFFGAGKMVPEFEAAAKKMDKPGQISDLVKTQFGYHIIKFTARLDPIQKPFEEVKPLIIPELKQRLAAKFQQDFIQSVLSGSKLEFDEKSLKSLQSSFDSQ